MEAGKLREEIVCAGFGGQGVIFMGKLLAYLGMVEGKHVTYIPSYGAEVRGGTANCTVIISSEEIASPVSSQLSSAIVMNKPSLNKFLPRVRKGGVLVLNSSLIKEEPGRHDLVTVKIPATKMATELGSSKVANMVALGAYLAHKRFIPLESALRNLKDVLPKRSHHLLEINRQALKKGSELVK